MGGTYVMQRVLQIYVGHVLYVALISFLRRKSYIRRLELEVSTARDETRGMKEVFVVSPSLPPNINNLSKRDVWYAFKWQIGISDEDPRYPIGGFKENKSVNGRRVWSAEQVELAVTYATYEYTNTAISSGQYPERVTPQRIWPALISRPCFHSVPLLRTIIIRDQIPRHLEIGYMPGTSICLRDQYVRNTYNRIVVGHRICARSIGADWRIEPRDWHGGCSPSYRRHERFGLVKAE